MDRLYWHWAASLGQMIESMNGPSNYYCICIIIIVTVPWRKCVLSKGWQSSSLDWSKSICKFLANILSNQLSSSLCSNLVAILHNSGLNKQNVLELETFSTEIKILEMKLLWKKKVSCRNFHCWEVICSNNTMRSTILFWCTLSHNLWISALKMETLMETPPKLKSEGLTSEEMLSDGIMMLMKPSIEHLDDKVHRVRWVVDIHVHFSFFSSHIKKRL